MPLPKGFDREDLASRAIYVGSIEHKTYASFAGPPAWRRSTATPCDPRFANQDELTAWLRAGIREGRHGAPWEGPFPRYVWYQDGDTWYEGMLVNSELGQYKGYALEPTELPESI